MLWRTVLSYGSRTPPLSPIEYRLLVNRSQRRHRTRINMCAPGLMYENAPVYFTEYVSGNATRNGFIYFRIAGETIVWTDATPVECSYMAYR